MKLETLLPLGKVDPGLREPAAAFDLHTIGRESLKAEELGYDSIMFEETKFDPYVVMALAANATRKVGIGTAVAIAFPRSPAVTAMSAWTLQSLSGGRFTLGLGTQVRAHIERRYGFKWAPAGPWMREYVLAVKEIWRAWQNSDQPNFSGQHYNINLTVPLFDPGPIDVPHIPIHLAAVNPYMCEVAGEVSEGLRPHPVCTADYIKNVMWPAVHRGAAKSSRSITDFSMSIKPLIATAPDEEGLQIKIRDIRARVAFYASTPAYRTAFEAHGLESLADDLKLLSRAQRWEEMPSQISDDVLHQFACVGTYDNIVPILKDRYRDIVTNVEFSIPVNTPEDGDILRAMISELRIV
jgi:probable F420-dependent oxidoreductase